MNPKLLEFGDTEELNTETLVYRTKVGIATLIINEPGSPISRAFILFFGQQPFKTSILVVLGCIPDGCSDDVKNQ